MDIKQKLDELSNMQAERQVIALQKQEIIKGLQDDRNADVDKILTPEMQSQIAAIDAQLAGELSDIDLEFNRDTEAVDANISKLEADIKDAVKEHGATVKGTCIQAVYSKGRTTWMTDKLEGLALAFPPLLAAKKVGEPSVSLRDVK